jgi:hypothetical protein
VCAITTNCCCFCDATIVQILTKEIRGHPVVSVQVWHKIGSHDESAAINGVSHLLEHLLFKGTKDRPMQFMRLFYMLGAEANAFTDFDVTVYHETAEKSTLRHLLALECDRMTNALIDDDHVLSERDVVVSELAGYEGRPAYRLSRAMMNYTFGESGYGLPVGGFIPEVQNFTVEQVQKHYNDYYGPKGATIVIVGDFNVTEAVQWVATELGESSLSHGHLQHIVLLRLLSEDVLFRMDPLMKMLMNSYVKELWASSALSASIAAPISLIHKPTGTVTKTQKLEPKNDEIAPRFSNSDIFTSNHNSDLTDSPRPLEDPSRVSNAIGVTLPSADQEKIRASVTSPPSSDKPSTAHVPASFFGVDNSHQSAAPQSKSPILQPLMQSLGISHLDDDQTHALDTVIQQMSKAFGSLPTTIGFADMNSPQIISFFEKGNSDDDNKNSIVETSPSSEIKLLLDDFMSLVQQDSPVDPSRSYGFNWPPSPSWFPFLNSMQVVRPPQPEDEKPFMLSDKPVLVIEEDRIGGPTLMEIIFPMPALVYGSEDSAVMHVFDQIVAGGHLNMANRLMLKHKVSWTQLGTDFSTNFGTGWYSVSGLSYSPYT